MWVAPILHPRAVHPISLLVPAHTAPPLQSDWSQAQCCSVVGPWSQETTEGREVGVIPKSRGKGSVMWLCDAPGVGRQVLLQGLESITEGPQQSPVTRLHASVPRGCPLLGLVANYRTNCSFFIKYVLQDTVKTKYIYYTLLFFVKNKSVKYSYQGITSKWCLSIVIFFPGEELEN